MTSDLQELKVTSTTYTDGELDALQALATERKLFVFPNKTVNLRSLFLCLR